jgi:thiol-disulfide isomerase/thioredoxin
MTDSFRPSNEPSGMRNQAEDAVSSYRYKRFTTSLLFRDLRFRKDAARPGDLFPSFELVTTCSDRLDNGNVFRDKPVLFIFGSMTCPMTASAAPSVQELYDEFGDRVDFIMLYVREAHPGENYRQAESMEEKLEHSRSLKEFYGIQWTVAADKLEGDLHRALDPKPNSAFLMNKDGMILFRSLWAADHNALHEALNAAAAGRVPERNQSVALIGPVTRAMGQVQEVMERGGPQAVRDLWRAGLPMALAGRIATFFSPLSPDQRGIAAVLLLALGMFIALGVLGAWVFA